MDPSRLSPPELDALKEAANIGAGHAATALSQLLREVVALEVPRVRALQLREVPEALGGAERVVAAIHLRLRGELRGNLLLALPPPAAADLLLRLGHAADDLHCLSPISASALRELGNILGAAYLSALSQLLHRSLIPSVPGLAVDMAGAVVDLLLMEIAGAGEQALVLETTFQETAGTVTGQVFLLPDPDDLVRLLQGLRARP